MRIPQRLVRTLVRQAHHPTGVVGRLNGLLFAHRPSNVARNRWVVGLLDPQPEESVLELGCGPGVAVAAFARRVTDGLVVAVDHSDVMIAQAGRRNAHAVRSGSVRLVRSAVEDLQEPAASFDVALAVNTVGMWRDPVTQLARIRHWLRPGGRIAIVVQPRLPGANRATTISAAERHQQQLVAAGFIEPTVDVLELDPPAACIRGRVATCSHG